MPLFEVVHRTRYHYGRPVTFGEHRAMLRPRDSHDLRLHRIEIKVRPEGRIRWMQDVFSNSIALIEIMGAATELVVESRLVLERFEDGSVQEPPRGETIATYPFTYPEAIRRDLGGTERRHYEDPKGDVAAWARQFEAGAPDSAALLDAMMRRIKAQFRYRARYERGTQSPAETLALGSGTCRDFALLMMEAARSLGFAARFVTGYLYDPAVDGLASGIRGAGATHAWLQIFLPLSGWIEYDPTNGIVGGRNLIRVGVARDPSQAIPLAGSYNGAAEDALGMDVDVTVRALGQGGIELLVDP
ncbi:MAG TPA: transglutaminase family protein [Hypericibacter adhaerens]|jgi:transglutaminase-like putative cysteine protease|uniref:Transglutaminase n=1 Tax=Hypericibacter adhaerens TaxID=2602016 RepID=A0A5J6MT41_9PROT|nr:transglutaminase family protein [Hypericibacter adhaerens]QEX20792.1 transglutaminase [Hypericibacter adhaerens]HWA46204.1 transglutaminase family protein [Hypericibacter adhaerens]